MLCIDDNEIGDALIFIDLCERTKVSIRIKEKKQFPLSVVIDQVEFFKLVDLFSLLRCRTYFMWEVLNDVNPRGDTIPNCITEATFDDWDVKPFRMNLFTTRHATEELMTMFKGLGMNDTNTSINNYDNIIEFKHKTFKSYMLAMANWVNEYIHVEYELMYIDALQKTINERERNSKIWSNHVLDSMWRPQRYPTTFHGSPGITYQS
jgi:hypothetical protein